MLHFFGTPCISEACGVSEFGETAVFPQTPETPEFPTSKSHIYRSNVGSLVVGVDMLINKTPKMLNKMINQQVIYVKM